METILATLVEGSLVAAKPVEEIYYIGEKVHNDKFKYFYVDSILEISGEVYSIKLRSKDLGTFRAEILNSNFISYNIVQFPKAILQSKPLQLKIKSADWSEIKKPLLHNIFCSNRHLKNYV